MEQSFYKQDSPVVIPAADGKYIAEHFGRASFGGPGLSVARMIAPPGWSEPFQNPEFDEYRAAAKEVADKFNAHFIPFQTIFDEAQKLAPGSYWTYDGVHPSLAGAALMAEAYTSLFI